MLYDAEETWVFKGHGEYGRHEDCVKPVSQTLEGHHGRGAPAVKRAPREGESGHTAAAPWRRCYSGTSLCADHATRRVQRILDDLASQTDATSPAGLGPVRRQELLLRSSIQPPRLRQALRCLELTERRPGPGTHHAVDLARIIAGVS
jgi:hypothetical protein